MNPKQILSTAVHLDFFSTKILEVNLFAFAYRRFHSQCPVDWREISMKQSVGKCKQINF